MSLKIRTIYFKAKDIHKLKEFYSQLFDIHPKPEKNTDDWVEFDFGNINLSFITLEDDMWSGSNCVPVFEFDTKIVDTLKSKVTTLGGVVLDEDYDGFNSAFCADIEGNQFEITTFHE